MLEDQCQTGRDQPCPSKNLQAKGLTFSFVVDINVAEHVQILSKPVMIMGADVSHPAPESRKFKPSIVAVTGSVEPKATQYETQVRLSVFSLVPLSVVLGEDPGHWRGQE